MKRINFTFLIFLPLFVSGQYDFEKHSAIKYKNSHKPKIIDTKEKAEYSEVIPKFYKNGESLTLQLTSFKEHWGENSLIRISKKNKKIKQFTENVAFNPNVVSVKIADINGDGLNDIKIVSPYMGNGLAALNVKVIYLFQQVNQSFIKISFDDMESDNRSERDFDGDGNYEIITMDLVGFENHNYWSFNLFNFVNGKFVNVNKKHNYPILVQFLEKDNYKITNKVSRQKMKSFTQSLPERYKSEK